MQAVILCGGLGTRLRPITNTIPKAMVPINGRPFLEYTIEALRHHNITDILFLTGYLGEKIKEHFGTGEKFGVSISYSDEGGSIGIAGSLRLAEPLLQDTFLLLYGDVYSPINYSHFVDSFYARGKKALVAVFPSEKNIQQPVYAKPHHLRVAEDDSVVKCNVSTEERNPEFNYREAGVSMLKKQALKLLLSPATRKEKFYPLSLALFNSLIQEQEISAYRIAKSFCEIGTPEEVLCAEGYMPKIRMKDN